MNVNSESVLFTIPDPYQVGPKVDEIDLPSATFGDLTVTGTFTIGALAFGAIELTDATNQIVFGPGPTNTTLNVVTPAANQTITIPDVGASASVVLTEGNQTVNGTKSFTSLAADQVIPITPGAGVDVGLIRIAEDTLVTPAITLDSLRSISGVATVSFAIMPTGNGAFLLEEPDNTSVGGNARGANAIDLQMNRVTNTEVASGSLAVILGGRRNTNAGTESVIVGGARHTIAANADWSFIGGGERHTVDTGMDDCVVCGGFQNTITLFGSGSFIGAGEVNFCRGLDCVVCGGAANEANIDYSGVVAGNGNIIGGGGFSFIGAGASNTNNGNGSAIGSGSTNTISDGNDNGVFTGANNVTGSSWSFIGGGQQNTIGPGSNVSNWSCIVGGLNNTIGPGPQNAIIGCGIGNSITGGSTRSGIFSGESNSITSFDSFIGGGSTNSVTSTYCGIICGQNNILAGSNSIIGSGNTNTIAVTGIFSCILGGTFNTVNAFGSSVVGGSTNIINANATFSVICGGTNQTIGDSSASSTIVGGSDNTIQPGFLGSFIGGGFQNTLGGLRSFIGAGQTNIISGPHNAIVCGFTNSITAQSSVIVAGQSNTISGGSISSFIGAGISCSIVGGSYNAIPAGQSCTVTGSLSMAFGNQAQATGTGVVTLSDSTAAVFANTLSNQFNARFANGYRLTGGAATISGGVLLATTGGTPSNLNFYQTATASITIQGPYAAPQAFSYAITRIGNNVSFTWQQALFAATVATVITSDPLTPLPPWAAPTNINPVNVLIWVENNSAPISGNLSIDNGGNFAIYAGFNGNFAGAGSAGPYSGTASWTII